VGARTWRRARRGRASTSPPAHPRALQSARPSTRSVVESAETAFGAFAGKLAKQLEKDGHTPLLVAADLQRPNAVHQRQVAAEQARAAVHVRR
jgi:hypothetical protein